MSLLYKYLDPDGALKTLSSMTLLASDPGTFNDPFEVRPAIDQERQDLFVSSHEKFYRAALGVPYSLAGSSSMVGIAPENAIGFSDRLHDGFINAVSSRFRVVCLSKRDNSVLMWGHYTNKHQGIVIGLDASVPDLQKGLRKEGFSVDYSNERHFLPIPFYHHPSVERLSLNGKLMNEPNEAVEFGGGVCAPFSHYQAEKEATFLRLLSTKAEDWKYENEVRFIYELKWHRQHLRELSGRHLLPVPPSCLKEIIFGCRATAALVNEILQWFDNGNLGSPALHFATCHPVCYQVQKHRETAEYLRKYYARL